MTSKIDWEKDHRSHLPLDLSSACHPICLELERACRNVPRHRVGQSNAYRDLADMREQLAAAIKLAQSEAFRRLFPTDGRLPHPVHRHKIVSTLKKLDELPRALMYKYSNARLPATESVISGAKRLSAQYSGWKKLLEPSSRD